MNTKLSPSVSVAILVVAIGIIATIMWIAVNQKGPPLPTSMGEAMRKSGAGPNARMPRRGPGQGQPGAAVSGKNG